MMKDDCIFCKLANGVFKTNTVYEDEDFRVILDASPAAKGHSLVIPKSHFDNALTADEKVLGKAMNVAAKTGRALMKTFGCDGINIVQNNGEAAGQTVFHLHLHVIPRYKDDNIGITWTGSYPKLVASISCCNASVERTTSPILISAFNEPAIPVLITASTLKYVASICVHIAAFTFPIPLLTTITSLPQNFPLLNIIPAISTVFASVIAATT